MPLPITIPNTFANATATIPLSQLDNNFATVEVAVNSIGNGAFSLANAQITGGTISNVTLDNVSVDVETLSNVTITNLTVDGNATFTNAAVTANVATITTANTTDVTASNSAVISVNTSGDALRITQTGTGNALVVEDSTNPDSTPFVITSNGDAIVGGTTAIASFQYSTPQLLVMGGSAGEQKGGQYTVVFSNNNVGPSIELGKSRSATVGTVGTIVQSGDQLGIISFNGDDGTDLRTSGATITASVDGTPGTNDMPGRLIFSTTADGASSPTERMRIDSSGNVGIGTSSPDNKLHVSQASTDFQVRVTGTSAANAGAIRAYNDGGEASIFGTTGSSNSGYGANLGVLGTVTNIPQVFVTNNTERARIDSSGNFGVGTTTPGASYSELVNFTATATNQPSLTLLNTNGSFANDVFQVRSANTSANGNSWNMITGWSSTTSLNFLVRGNGNVLNTNNSYGSLSDHRIKENIVDATPKLENLKQVRVVNFNLIGDEQKQIGVVAQELEQVFPGMVEEDQEGIKAVKYSVFVPMLIKAIQEQQQMIETLQAEVAALKGA